MQKGFIGMALIILILMLISFGSSFYISSNILNQNNNYLTETIQTQQLETPVVTLKDNLAKVKSNLVPTSDKDFWKQNFYRCVSYNLSPESKCSMDNLSIDDILDTYAVQKGDNYSSIATKIFGTADRAEELKQLNQSIMPRFKSECTNEVNLLEVGWNIHLVPKFVSSTSGIINAFNAEVVEESDKTWTLLTQDGMCLRIVQKADNPALLGKENFHTGDCVSIMVDQNNGYKALAISPQDKNFFKK